MAESKESTGTKISISSNPLVYPPELDSESVSWVAFTIYEYNDGNLTPSTGLGSNTSESSSAADSSASTTKAAENGVEKPDATSTLNTAKSFYGSRKALASISQISKTIKNNIFLPMPLDTSVSYNGIWEDANSPVLGAAYDAWKGSEGVWDSIVKVGGAALTGFLSKEAFSNDNFGYFGAQIGITNNPRKALLFKDMQFREFQFEFHMFARSDSEALTIRSIIHAFKAAAHPDASLGSLYKYPYELKIEYVNNNALNKYMHKFGRCVLTGVDVKYSPDGLFVSHKDGSPTHIILNLRVKEIEVLTRDKHFKDSEDTY